MKKIIDVILITIGLLSALFFIVSLFIHESINYWLMLIVLIIGALMILKFTIMDNNNARKDK